MNVGCTLCGGSGEIECHGPEDLEDCPRCEGTGLVECPKCLGTGLMDDDD